ncbi:uncharacterized protein B0I36DRAFT_317247 [Microdochium trichocladiopsis]|uniref:Uncharacterized protein n=1 Tax=Microdochium trichocladiopsis TaxID=1682393 RepID=A0A9P8YBJ6_9PEZI|nr:uncharacterized protein B0I36DRAFT_317247 [Microdochium trichocladiopsis]KAH7034930.1 hypothetical protein B0I36DRAFT_317247 [Microdochium trichocladiopsis]
MNNGLCPVRAARPAGWFLTRPLLSHAFAHRQIGTWIWACKPAHRQPAWITMITTAPAEHGSELQPCMPIAYRRIDPLLHLRLRGGRIWAAVPRPERGESGEDDCVVSLRLRFSSLSVSESNLTPPVCGPRDSFCHRAASGRNEEAERNGQLHA